MHQHVHFPLLSGAAYGDQYALTHTPAEEREVQRRDPPLTYRLNMPMFSSWVITEPSTAPKNFPVCKHKKGKNPE